MFNRVVRIDDYSTVIHIDEVKNQLNIVDFNEDDDLLLALIPAACQLVESGTNHVMTNSTVICALPVDGTASEFLPKAPWPDSPDDITVQMDGVDVDFSFNYITGKITVTGVTGDVVITYPSGYDRDTLPKVIKQAVMMSITNIYEHRGDTSTQSLSKVSMTVNTLMQAAAWRGV